MGRLYTRLRRSLSENDEKHWYSFWFEKLVDIKDWTNDKVYYKPKATIKSIKRVIDWIPVLWNNYDRDFAYLFQVMRYKLDRMEKYIRAEGNASNSSKTADEIKTAKLLLDRICEDGYLDNAVKHVEAEWGTWDFDFSSPRLRKVWKKGLSETEEKQANRDTLRAYKHSDYMQKQDIGYVFEYITKHHKKWWD